MGDTPKQIPKFPNRRAVLLSIQDAGFQVSRAKFYRDCGEPGRESGLIRVNADGSVDEGEVREYCKGLKRIEGNIEDLKDIAALKGEKEVEKLEEQIAKLRFDRLKDEKKYIPRKDFEAELAARAIVIESGLRHMFSVKLPEIIGIVGGNIAKSADLLDLLNKGLDEQLNTFATLQTFQVLFEEEED